MSWRDLLQKEDDHVVAPWLGGRSLRLGPRKWTVDGKLPTEQGWYRWSVQGRRVHLLGEGEPWKVDTGLVTHAAGYLVGDLLVRGLEAPVEPSPEALRGFPRVHLLPDGLDHFTPVCVGRVWEEGPWLFIEEDFPWGSEDEVRDRFLDNKDIEDVSGVTPSLELAFRMLKWRQAQEEKHREEIRKAREREARMREMKERLGDGQIRRDVAKLNFREAAKAALAVGGAELIDTRPSTVKGEFVVRYRVDGGRYECVCDGALHIIDSGICLQDHDTGEKGDTYFTLESLPGVTRQARLEGAAIWRHV